MRTKRWFSIAVAAVFLAGCGGNGGGSVPSGSAGNGDAAKIAAERNLTPDDVTAALRRRLDQRDGL